MENFKPLENVFIDCVKNQSDTDFDLSIRNL